MTWTLQARVSCFPFRGSILSGKTTSSLATDSSPGAGIYLLWNLGWVLCLSEFPRSQSRRHKILCSHISGECNPTVARIRERDRRTGTRQCRPGLIIASWQADFSDLLHSFEETVWNYSLTVGKKNLSADSYLPLIKVHHYRELIPQTSNLSAHGWIVGFIPERPQGSPDRSWATGSPSQAKIVGLCPQAEGKAGEAATGGPLACRCRDSISDPVPWCWEQHRPLLGQLWSDRAQISSDVWPEVSVPQCLHL